MRGQTSGRDGTYAALAVREYDSRNAVAEPHHPYVAVEEAGSVVVCGDEDRPTAVVGAGRDVPLTAERSLDRGIEPLHPVGATAGHS